MGEIHYQNFLFAVSGVLNQFKLKIFSVNYGRNFMRRVPIDKIVVYKYHIGRF